MHLQIRTAPVQSPPDLAAFLAVLERARINIIAAGGSNLEHDGEFAFAVEDGVEDAAVEALRTAGYQPRVVEVDHYLVTDNPGQLLGCVAATARKNGASRRKIKDLAVGPRPGGGVLVQIYSE